MPSLMRVSGLVVHLFEHALVYAADRARPVVREGLERRPRGDSRIRVPLLWIVDVTANGTRVSGGFLIGSGGWLLDLLFR